MWRERRNGGPARSIARPPARAGSQASSGSRLGPASSGNHLKPAPKPSVRHNLHLAKRRGRGAERRCGRRQVEDVGPFLSPLLHRWNLKKMPGQAAAAERSKSPERDWCGVEAAGESSSSSIIRSNRAAPEVANQAIVRYPAPALVAARGQDKHRAEAGFIAPSLRCTVCTCGSRAQSAISGGQPGRPGRTFLTHRSPEAGSDRLQYVPGLKRKAWAADRPRSPAAKSSNSSSDYEEWFDGSLAKINRKNRIPDLFGIEQRPE